jgi:membrane-associated phospholipid phosphatase
MLLGAALILAFLFLGAGIQIGLLNFLDVSLFTVVNSTHNDLGDSLMVVFSLYGREVVWGGLAVCLFIFGGKVEKKTAITLGLVFIILLGVGYATKEVYSRERPYDALGGVRLLVNEESDGSYPSGHTLIVAAGAVVALVYLKRSWALLLTVEAGLVAYSRMYVGVHYPSDIVGGVLLGAGCALIICAYPRIMDRVYDALPLSLRGK